jgi:aminoglycoside phosphotransferase (APT) family kinase protein
VAEGATTPAGVDADGVTRWLAGQVEAVAPPLTFSLVQGGRSNLTYVVADTDGRRWVLRRPPLHAVLPSAHDMRREHTVISALGPTDVPVPATLGYEPDESVTGAEFYVMDYVDGEVVRDRQAAGAVLDSDEQRRTAGESLVDVLVGLHAVDPDAVGLSDFGRKQGYVERQLNRWHGQLAKGREHGARQLPVLDDVFRRLIARIPEQGRATVVHGDYRLDNVILGPEGRVRAVLDWELSTLGDPLADVGLLAVYWTDPGDPTTPLLSAPTAMGGFPRRGEVIARYADRSGRDLSQLDFYVAFAFWKLAIILEGVYSRFASGAYGSTGDDSWRQFGDVVLRLGEQAQEAAGKAGR